MIKNILFYNLYHIGDTFFAQPFIKEFCKLNIDYNISLFVNYNWGLYKDIENLNIIDIDDNYRDLNFSPHNFTPENLINYNDTYYSILNTISNKDIYKVINDDTLCINTWIGSWNYVNQPVSYECSPININNRFIDIIKDINNNYNLDLKYNTPEILLPILPKMTVDFNKTTKSIFYYNYFPRSGQVFPLDFSHHDMIIQHLSSKFKDYIIYIPFKSNIQCENVVYTRDKFNIIETPSCKNVIENVHIAMLCDIVMSYDIGACFYYCNSLINSFKGQWYHVGVTSLYFTEMFNSHKNENVKFIQASNYGDVINLIDRLLYPMLSDC